MTARDEWCTPKWLAEALGEFDIDPCSNDRSHIKAETAVDVFGDGLHWWPWGVDAAAAGNVPRDCRVFINPPYSRGQVLKWVRHWSLTDFTFLLRWDPSTEWFRELMPRVSWVWFAHRRIQFEPPPGVKASTNPYPHALYFRNPPQGEQYDRLADLGRFLSNG